VTLVELLVVLALLVGLATLVTLRVGAGTAIELRDGVTRTPKEVITMATLTALRDAIVGAGAAAGAGYLADLGHPPSCIADLLAQPEGEADFDPATARGWRGPYVQGVTLAYVPAPELGFTTVYAAPEAAVPGDAWGRPVVLQIPDADADGAPSPSDLEHARLVSAGADGLLATPRTDADVAFDPDPVFPSHSPSLKDCGDDLLLYLFVPDQRLDNTDA